MATNGCRAALRAFAAALLVAAALPCAAAESRPVVTGIQAAASGSNKITVSWVLPSFSRGQRIVRQNVYRSTRPFTTKDDITEEALVATLDYTASSYTDTVRDWREYYYAVITLTGTGDFGEEELFYDEETDSLPEEEEAEATPYLVVLPGVNATVRGSRVQLPSRASQVSQDSGGSSPTDTAAPREKRTLPLAYLELEGTGGTHERTISEETEALARTLTRSGTAARPFTDPYVFEEDLVQGRAGTDDYRLFSVLKTSFITGNYRRAAAELTLLLLEIQDADTLRRARFYLGESYYFCGDYASAVTSFLCTEEDMSPLVRKWTESALDLYEIPLAD